MRIFGKFIPFYRPEDETGAGENPVESSAIENNEEKVEVPAEEAVPQPNAEPQADWRDKQINKQHRILKDKDAEIERLRREREDLLAIATRNQQNEEAPVAPVAPPPDELITQRAEQLFAERTYNEDCNRANSEGGKEFGADWQKALDRLPTLGGIDRDTMVSILATDAPHKVLFELGSKPEEYHRIMDLPPAKRMSEFVKITLSTNSTPRVSKAPAPVEPIQGSGSSRAPTNDIYDDKLTDEEFYALRAKQKAERFANGRR